MPITLTTYVNEVMPDVIGCPSPLVENEVRNVLAEFCGSTGILQKGFKKTVLSTDPATPNDHIDITTPTAMALYMPCDIQRLKIDGVDYEAIKREITDDLTDMDEVEEDGVKFWYPSTTTNIVMYPFEATACELYLQVAFKPTSGILVTTELDAVFYEDWHKVIVAGVKANLLVMPKKAWSGENSIVSWHKEIYEKGVDAAKIQVLNALDRTISKAKNQFI